MPNEASHDDIERLQDELARVARQTARLLLQPRYDETELAELDVRARELRARIRSIGVNGKEADLLTEARMSPTRYGSGSLSGGYGGPARSRDD